MTSKKKTFDFEQALSALQSTVEQLESGDLSLEDDLQAFEKGIGLTRDCQQALNQAQQRISTLLEQNGQLQETAFTDNICSPASAEKEDDDIPF